MYKCAKILSDQLNAISILLLIFRGQQPTKHMRLQGQSFCLSIVTAPVTRASVVVTSEPARKG